MEIHIEVNLKGGGGESSGLGVGGGCEDGENEFVCACVLGVKVWIQLNNAMKTLRNKTSAKQN